MSKCSMSKKIESLRKQNEASARDFRPEFYVADIHGTQATDYGYDTYNQAVAAARALSKQNPGTPYTIDVAIGSPVICNGKVMDRDEYMAKHPEFNEKLGTRARKRSVREQKGLKATVVGGELEGTYDVEALWKYANGKTPASSDGPLSRAILGNQPILPGYLGPMWNGDGLRYETPEVYRQLSQ